MSGVEMFDRAVANAERRGDGAGTSKALAARLVQSLLGDVQYLWDLYFSFGPEEDRGAELMLRGMFEQWAREADSAIERVERIEREEGTVPGFDQLQHQHGRVGAMLSVSLADLDTAREQIRTGQTFTAEEVRRELRLRSQR
jgi:hypothetical protein